MLVRSVEIIVPTVSHDRSAFDEHSGIDGLDGPMSTQQKRRRWDALRARQPCRGRAGRTDWRLHWASSDVAV